MGKRPTLREKKSLHAKFEHVRNRRPEIPAAHGYGAAVTAMIEKGGSNAPQSEQLLNKMINGYYPVNVGWLTLISQIFNLPGLRGEDWYDLTDMAFFDKVDAIVCHDPVDVLTGWSDVTPDLELSFERTSPRWGQEPCPAVKTAQPASERGITVGTPRHRVRLVHPTAIGDGLIVRARALGHDQIEVFNVDDPVGQSPKVYLITSFTNLASSTALDPLVIGRADGLPLPVDGYTGESRLFVVATSKRIERAWQPQSDGLISIAQLRDFVINMMRLPEGEGVVLAGDYHTFPSLP